MHNIFKALVALSTAAAIFPAAAMQAMPDDGGRTPAAKAEFEKCTIYAQGTKDVPPVPCKSVKRESMQKSKSTGRDAPAAAPTEAKAAPLTLSNNRSR